MKGKYRFPHTFSTEGQISSEMSWKVGLAWKSTVALREVWSSLNWIDPHNDSLGEGFFGLFFKPDFSTQRQN